jgi:hypothetical protein
MLGIDFYCMIRWHIPSYSGSIPSRTAFAIYGLLPISTVGIGDILRADIERGDLNEIVLVLGILLNTSDLAGRVASL